MVNRINICYIDLHEWLIFMEHVEVNIPYMIIFPGIILNFRKNKHMGP